MQVLFYWPPHSTAKWRLCCHVLRYAPSDIPASPERNHGQSTLPCGRYYFSRKVLFFPSNIRFFFCRLSAPHAIFSSSYHPLKSNRPQSPCFGVSSTLFNQSYFANERWRADFLNPLDGLIETEMDLQINVFSNWRVCRFQNKTAPYFVRLFRGGQFIFIKMFALNFCADVFS